MQLCHPIHLFPYLPRFPPLLKAFCNLIKRVRVIVLIQEPRENMAAHERDVGARAVTATKKKTPQQRELESLKLSSTIVQARHSGRIEIVSRRSASPNACRTRDDDPMAPGGGMANINTGACLSTYGAPSERAASPRSRKRSTNNLGRDEDGHSGYSIPGREDCEEP